MSRIHRRTERPPQRARGRVLPWLLGVPLGLVLLIGAVLALIDWGFLIEPLERRAGAALGRPVEIGAIDLGLLPRPQLVLHRVRVGHGDDADGAPLFRSERLALVPDASALLHGRLEIAALHLGRPRLTLPAEPAEAAEDAGAGGPDTAAALSRIGQLRLTDGRLRYRPPEAEQPIELRIPVLSLDPDGGGWRLTGRARYGERPVVELAGDLRREDTAWRLSGLQAGAGDSDLSGELILDTGRSPRLEAGLRADRLNLTPWLAGQRPQDEPGIRLPEPPGLALAIDLAAERIDWRDRRLDEVDLSLRAADGIWRLEDSAVDLAGGRATLDLTLEPGPGGLSADGRLVLDRIHVGRAAAALDLAGGSAAVRPADLSGRLGGSLELRLRGLPADGFTPASVLERLRLSGGELVYRTAGSADGGPQTRLRLRPRTVESEDGPVGPVQVRIEVEGRARGRPVQAALTLDPLADLLERPDDYRLAVAASSRSLELEASSTIGRLGGAERRSLDARLAYARIADLGAWLPVGLPELPAGRLSGVLAREDAVWRLTGLDARLGDTRLQGSLRLKPGEPPLVQADLSATRLDLDGLLGAAGGSTEKRGDTPPLTELLGRVDGELRLDAAAVTLPEAPTLTDLSLAAELTDRRLQARRLAFDASGGRVEASGSLDARRQPVRGDLEVRFERLQIARQWRSATAPAGELGRLSGRLRLTATGTGAAVPDARLRLPFLGRLRLAGQARFTGPEPGTAVDVKVETRDLDAGEQRTLASASGQWYGEAVKVAFEGDRLLDIRDPEAPYGLDLQLDFGDTRIGLQGSVTRPLDLAGADLDIRLQGPNPQRLYRLLGLPLPDLPPYRLEGRLALRDSRWSIEDLSGRVGDSDLSGSLSLDVDDATPVIRARLRSQRLDLDDLGGLLGLPPAVGDDETASPAQARRARAAGGDAEVLPETRFAFERIRNAAADVTYRSRRVQAGGLPLDDLEIDMELRDGEMIFDPLDFGIGDGEVRARLRLDARETSLQAVLETEVRRVDLQRVFRDLPLADQSRGLVGGQGKLWLRGRSTAELLASADGGMNLLMTGGGLDAQLVELAGLDLGEALLAELTNRPAVPIDCAYTDLQFRAGRMRLARAVIDSADTLFELDGVVDFGAERFDVTIRPYPKDVSAPAARSPLHLTGPFGNAELEVDQGELAVRALAAVGLGALAGPVAALMPLIETGPGGENASCGGLVGRMKEAQDESAGL